MIMAQAAINEAVDELLGEIAEAWNAGDARAYAARYCTDGTFTNTN
jgi:ketosteroid isomerase-like protein